jgi:alpha-beta hydrolase superfamily lysophospholipase
MIVSFSSFSGASPKHPDFAMPHLDTTSGGSPIRIYYEEEGSGPPVVLVGGLTSTVETWGLQRPALAEFYRVIMPDNRGSGRTRVPDDEGHRSIDGFAADLLALLDGLELSRVHLVGASMGGLIVQDLRSGASGAAPILRGGQGGSTSLVRRDPQPCPGGS